MSREFLLFCLSGSLAFALDAGVTQGLVLAGLDPFSARALAVFLAVSFTWAFNRRLTFAAADRSEPRWRQWLRYLLAQSGGAAVNYAAYSVVILWVPFTRQWPWLAVAVGSLAGLAVNYSTARRWIFKRGA